MTPTIAIIVAKGRIPETWVATVENSALEGQPTPTGYGKTPLAAVDDLINCGDPDHQEALKLFLS